MNTNEQSDDLFVTERVYSLYVFWKQDDASASEIAAIREIDPRFHDKTISEVSEMVKDQVVWRVGPFSESAQADAVESQLRSKGFTVQRKEE